MSLPGTRSRRASTFGWIGAVGVTVALFVVGLPYAAAGPVNGAATAAGTTWAYGALRETNITGTLTGLLGVNFVYNARATIGFATVFNETQGAHGALYLNASRVMGSNLHITYCRPNCLVPLATGTIDHRAWESINDSSILSTQGSVLAGTVSVAALALNQSDLLVSAGVHDTTTAVSGGVIERSLNLSAHLSATDAVSFSPGLGLVPLNLTDGEQWTSTSSVAQVGSFGWSLSNIQAGALLTPKTYVRNGSGSFNGTGTVTIAGSDARTNLSLGGSWFRALNLSVTGGAFTLREGWMLLPAPADTFGATSQAWESNESGFANVTQTSVDVGARPVGTGHLAFGGSAEWWFPSSLNPAAAVVGTSGAMPLTSAPAVVRQPNATFLQASPETPSQATSQQNCLSAGVGCPAGSFGPRNFLGILLVGGAVAGVTLLAVVLTVGQRRRMPPSVFPNSALYPPGQAVVPRTVGPTDGSKPRPPNGKDEDDPLANLW